MSEERRKRKQAREQQDNPQPNPMVRTVAIGVVIALAIGLLVYLGIRKRNQRYDAFARCTAQRGARMYGAFWCPHCLEQKEAFGSSFQYVNYIECGVKGDPKGQTQVCKDAVIKHYPTWVFLDESRVEGKQSFEFLSQQTGCPLP